MRLKLTLHRGEGDPVDIVVTTDSTATAGDVARHIAESDPTRTLAFADGSTLTLAVAPPTDARMVPLHPDVAIGEAPIGSGFAASIVEVGAGYVAADRREVVGVLRATAGPLAGQEFRCRRAPSRSGATRVTTSCWPTRWSPSATPARGRRVRRGRRPQLRQRRARGRRADAARAHRGRHAVRDRRNHARPLPDSGMGRLGRGGPDHRARWRTAVQPQPPCRGALSRHEVQAAATAHREDRQGLPLAGPLSPRSSWERRCSRSTAILGRCCSS